MKEKQDKEATYSTQGLNDNHIKDRYSPSLG
jgi:hypothetical protein